MAEATMNFIILNAGLFSFCGAVYIAVFVIRTIDNRTRNSVVVFRVTKDQTINSHKGRIVKGGMLIVMGPNKLVDGHSKFLVKYMGENGDGEAETGTTFWVRAESLRRCSHPETLAIDRNKEQTLLESEPEPEAAYHSEQTQAHLETSHALRQWDRYTRSMAA